ncbi:MAG: hypothetical protein SVM80_03860 [Halobacteriota archaeon]|nr:hypothetical protein [Halobacteriota archaeon]
MEKEKRRKIILTVSVLAVYIFIRLLILVVLLSGGGPDAQYYVGWGSTHLDDLFATKGEPPLKEMFFIIPVALSRHFSLDPIHAVNMFVFSFDIGIGFLLYKIARKYYDYRGAMLIFLAFSLPTTYTYSLLEAQDEIIATFFFMLMAYAFLNEKWKTLTVSFFALVNILVFPIFLLPFIYRLLKEEKFFLIVTSIFVIFCGIFLVHSPDIILSTGGGLLGRGLREGHLAFMSPYTILMMKGWYDPVRILAFGFFVVATLLCLNFIPNKIQDNDAKFLFYLILFNLCFVIFFPVPYHHYLAWCFPLMFLIVPYKFSKERFLFLLFIYNVPWMAGFGINAMYNAQWILSRQFPLTAFLEDLLPYVFPIIAILLIVVYLNHYALLRLNYDFYGNFLDGEDGEKSGK